MYNELVLTQEIHFSLGKCFKGVSRSQEISSDPSQLYLKAQKNFQQEKSSKLIFQCFYHDTFRSVYIIKLFLRSMSLPQNIKGQTKMISFLVNFPAQKLL